MSRAMRFLCAVSAAAVLLSCGGSSAAEKQAERERLAEARTRLAGWETKLASSDGRGELAVESLRSILGIQAMELNESAAAVERFEANRELLKGDRMARVYDAVARSKMAGFSKKIEDKLSWLRQGMAAFESLREDFPDDESVFLYQASTYASFPAEVGAKADVLDILAETLERYLSGSWTLVPGAAGQVVWIFDALSRNYPDDESGAEIEELRSRFRSSLQVFDEVYRQSSAEAGHE